jgi:hypothetical protein
LGIVRELPEGKIQGSLYHVIQDPGFIKQLFLAGYLVKLVVKPATDKDDEVVRELIPWVADTSVYLTAVLR